MNFVSPIIANQAETGNLKMACEIYKNNFQKKIDKMNSCWYNLKLSGEIPATIVGE